MGSRPLTSGNYPGSPFVGREPELAAAREALASTLDGRGRIILLTGEPGIGKTRTAEQILDDAREHDALVLWGRCQEWEGAPAYWPWLQILRRYVERTSEATVREDLSGLAIDLSQIMPELEQVAGREQGDLAGYSPEQRRFRLFDAMARLLRAVTSRQPIVLVLDDIHWADQPSLRLLEFIAQDVHELPLLLIATYRNVEIDRQHPLTGTLAELSRDPASRRTVLRGLGDADVSRYIELTSDRQPPPGLVEAVLEETGGNPFFMTEVVGWLRSEGRLDEGHTGTWTIRIPESIREAVGNRLDRLGPEANEVLTVASVIGREFDLQRLARTAARETLDLLDLLDEAVQAGVVEELDQPGSYRFSHALIQETLYSELTTSRRLRFHAQIGTAIEALHGDNLAPHYTELAYHFSESALAGNTDKAIDYATRAGDQAMEQLAFEAAIGHYINALGLMESTNDESRLPILFGMSHALRALGNFERSQDVALEGTELARSLNRPDDIVRGARAYAGGDHDGTWTTADPQAVLLLREALVIAAEDDVSLQVDLRRRLVQRLPISPDSFKERRALADEAIRIAERDGDRTDRIQAYVARQVALMEGPDSFSESVTAERLELQNTILAMNPQGSQAYIATWMFWSNLNERLIAGNIEMSELRERIDQNIQDMAQTRVSAFVTAAYLVQMMSFVMEGRFSAAEELGLRLAENFDNSVLFDGAWPGQYLFIIYREESRLQDLIGDLRRFARDDHDWETYWQIRIILAHLETGEMRTASREFADITRDGFATIRPDWAWLENMVTLGEIAHLLDDRVQAARILERLKPYAHLNAAVRFGSDFIGSVSYYLGLLATTLERWNEADEHFRFALDRHKQMKLPPYIANTQHQYASMLAKRGASGDLDRARGLNEAALATARELGMVRLDRLATALAKEIDASDGAIQSDGIAYDLTPRELEVLGCLVRGSTDREIADELSISPRTVQVHVSNILGKLDAGSRTAAAALAIREGLV